MNETGDEKLASIGLLDRIGVIKDLSPEQVPDGGFSDASNVRFINGRVQTLPGYFGIATGANGLVQRIMAGLEYVSLNFLGATLARYLVVVVQNGPYYFNAATGLFQSIIDTALTGSADQPVMLENGFGQLLIANGKDAVRTWSGPGASVSVLAGMTDCAPGGITCVPAIIRAFKNFLVALNNVENGVAIPNGVRWSKFGTSTVWKNDPVTGAGQAGSNPLNNTPDEIHNALILHDFLVIYKKDSIYLMSYVGPPAVFAFTEAVTNRGLLSPLSVVNQGDYHLFLSDDGFFAFDGYQIVPIDDEKIRNFFLNDLNPKYGERVFAVIYKQFGEVWWFYSSESSLNGNADKAIIYNYKKKIWSLASFPLSGANLDGITAAWFYTQVNAVTWQNAPTLPWGVISQEWDDVLFSPSQPALQIGDDLGNVYQHGMVYSQNGAAYVKQATTKLHDFRAPAERKRLYGIKLATDTFAYQNMQVYVGTCDNPGDVIVWNGPYPIKTGFGAPMALFDLTAVYFAFKFQSATTQDPWQVTGFSVMFDGESMQ